MIILKMFMLSNCYHATLWFCKTNLSFSNLHLWHESFQVGNCIFQFRNWVIGLGKWSHLNVLYFVNEACRRQFFQKLNIIGNPWIQVFHAALSAAFVEGRSPFGMKKICKSILEFTKASLGRRRHLFDRSASLQQGAYSTKYNIYQMTCLAFKLQWKQGLVVDNN